MSVKSCKLKHNSRRGPAYRKDGSRSYRETWVVEVTSADDDGRVVMGASGLPHRGQGYPEDSLAVVTDLDPQQSAESELVWYVDVTYAWEPAQPPSTGQQPLPGPPSEQWWRAQRFWSTLVYTTSPQVDLDGKVFKNSAGDPFEQPPDAIEVHRLLTVKQRRTTWNEWLIMPFMDQGTINDDAITIDGRVWPPLSALVRQWNGEQNWYANENGEPVEYWNRTVEIEFNPKLWHPVKIVQQGRRCKIVGQTGIHQTRDDNDVADGHLALLTTTGFEVPRTVEQAFYAEFRSYQLKSFATLMQSLEIPQQ